MGGDAHHSPLPDDVIDALEAWAARHRAPHTPIWEGGTATYTPASFTRDATGDPNSAAAAFLRRSLASGLTIEEILDALS